MRKSYQQFAIVTGDTAQQLTDRLNEKLIELSEKKPTVSFEGMIARISYTEEEDRPESLADEYKAKGIQLSCQDCPFFGPIYKADGTIDKRIKYGDCQFAKYGRAFRDSMACETLFEKINSGEVRLCLPAEE